MFNLFKLTEIFVLTNFPHFQKSMLHCCFNMIGTLITNSEVNSEFIKIANKFYDLA